MSQFGETVIGKLDKIGKIKLSTDTLGDDERRKLKIKTMIYFLVDACIVLCTGYIIINDNTLWKACHLNFYPWLLSVFIFNCFSFLISIFTFVQISRGQFQMWLLVCSTILEVGILVLAIFAIEMAARSKYCIPEFTYIKLVVFILSAVLFVRVFQTLLIILFIICCVPCFCCDDDCFIKRRLMPN